MMFLSKSLIPMSAHVNSVDQATLQLGDEVLEVRFPLICTLLCLLLCCLSDANDLARQGITVQCLWYQMETPQENKEGRSEPSREKDEVSLIKSAVIE